MPNQNRGGFGLAEEGRATINMIIASPRAIQDAAARMSEHALSMSEHALISVTVHAMSTARIIISAEELLQQRVRSAMRVAVATVFFAISGLISLGANVTTVFAKKVSPNRGSHGETLRVKKSAKQGAARVHYRHRGKLSASRRYGLNSKAGRNATHGMASWYGNEFHNRRTASGVRFDTHAMMAAHRTLPFGTKVRVTNLKNSKSCVVEITDRGPFARGRIIDLSYAAAEELGMTESGVANVEIQVVGNRLGMQRSLENLSSMQKSPALDRIQRASSRPLASLLNAPVSTNDDAGH